MRTDHVTAWLIKLWLDDHFPDIGMDWNLEVSDQVKGFAQRLETIIPMMRWLFVSQNILARTAIDMWDFTDVALLAGGTPTPLTPPPEQLRYFTDGNPEAVAEAEASGYFAKQVDVSNGADIGQLHEANTAIATGLLHFLPDPVAQKLFQRLDNAGFHTFAFSQATPEVDREAIEQYEKLGIQFFLRNEDTLSALLPNGWEITYQERLTDMMQHAGEIGARIGQEDIPHMGNFYMISKSNSKPE